MENVNTHKVHVKKRKGNVQQASSYTELDELSNWWYLSDFLMFKECNQTHSMFACHTTWRHCSVSCSCCNSSLPFEGSVCQLKFALIPDNHIGLSNSLWLTLICFAAQREYTVTMSLCSLALVSRLMASERIQLRGWWGPSVSLQLII